MGRTRITVVGALALVILTGSALVAPPARAACAPGPLANECAEYGSHPRQVMDILYGTRSAPSSRAAVLFIHGGGWVAGDKASMNGLAREITGFGWVGFSMNYRLAGNGATAPYVDAPADVHAAVNWIRANAAAFSIDPNRIALVGASAGAHLAMLHGTRHGSQSVRAVVSFAGPTDLTTLALLPPAVPYIRAYVGGCNVLLCLDRHTGGSPSSFVNRGDPPTMIVHGLLDTLVPIDQALRMALLLQLSGVHQELIPCVCGHDGGLMQHWPAVRAFLQRQLA
ncbi:MAG: alpha/beta hydrolase fold domain-containing protein [Acidimicrobiales bacterium]